MNNVRNWIAAFVLVGGLALSPGAHGQDAEREPLAAASQTAPRRIAYKEENSDGFGVLALRLGGGLVLMAILAFAAAVLAKRYLPGVRGYSLDGKSRIQLLESRRITPKLTLFLLEYEGRQLLLAQSGERIVELGAARGTDERAAGE